MSESSVRGNCIRSWTDDTPFLEQSQVRRPICRVWVCTNSVQKKRMCELNLRSVFVGGVVVAVFLISVA